MYRQWVEQLPKDVQREMQQEVDAIAADVADAIRRTAPEDQGDLKRSIRVVDENWAPDNPNVRGVKVMVKSAGGISAGIVAGDRLAWYAAMVEYGTVKMRAQPYFWPIWRAKKKDVRRRLAKAWRGIFKSGRATRPGT